MLVSQRSGGFDIHWSLFAKFIRRVYLPNFEFGVANERISRPLAAQVQRSGRQNLRFADSMAPSRL